MSKPVTIVHADGRRSEVMPVSVPVWLDLGWRLEETGAGVEETTVLGEGPQVIAPPAPDHSEGSPDVVSLVRTAEGDVTAPRD